ncbi:MAG: hypothetical protein WBI40_03125 [Methylococcaceae bacterium]
MKKLLCVFILAIISTQPAYADGEKVAAFGAYMGASAAYGAIYASGVTGLGATGVTSGLAAIGSIVGGGMTAGLVVTAAAPIAGGVAAYGLYKWLKD